MTSGYAHTRSLLGTLALLLLLAGGVACALETVTPDFIRTKGKQSVVFLRTSQAFWKGYKKRLAPEPGSTEIDPFYFYFSQDALILDKWESVEYEAEWGLDTAEVTAGWGGYVVEAGSDNHRIGAFLLGDAYLLKEWESQRAEVYFQQNYPESRFDPDEVSWDVSNAVIGGFYQNASGLGIRIGYMEEQQPRTRVDSGGTERFTISDASGEENMQIYQGSHTTFSPYYEVQWKQYTISSLWNLQGSPRTLYLAPGAFAFGTLQWEPSLLWDFETADFRVDNLWSRTQVFAGRLGASQQEYNLGAGRLSSHFIASSQAEATLFQSQQPENFDAYLRGGLSACYLYPDFFIGGKAGLAMDRIFTILDLNLQYSYDFSQYASKLGAKPGGVFSFAFTVAW